MSTTSKQEERARRLHAEALILLAHDHFPPPADLAELRTGNVTAKILMTVVDVRLWAETRDDYLASIQQIDGWYAYAEAIYKATLHAIAATPELLLIRTAGDFLQAKRENRIGILLGAEGGKLIEHRLENLHALHAMGLRHILLTWAYNNQLAAGELDLSGRGLTDFGREVVVEMNRLGMIVDITHLSRPAMRDVLELSSRPVLNSHSSLKTIANRIPAMTELEIKALAEKGGVIALHFMTHMLTGRFEPRAELEDVLRQIDAIVNMGGIDCLALGPDYLPNTLEFKCNTGQENLTFPVGLESPAGTINLIRGLVSRGYDDEQIQKILGGNLLRLMREVIGD